MRDLDLNGLWQFRFCENVGLDAAEAGEYPDWMCVPGVFDEYRRPKLAAQAVAEAFARHEKAEKLKDDGFSAKGEGKTF